MTLLRQLNFTQGLTCTEYLSSSYSCWAGNPPSVCYWSLGAFYHDPNWSRTQTGIQSSCLCMTCEKGRFPQPLLWGDGLDPPHTISVWFVCQHPRKAGTLVPDQSVRVPFTDQSCWIEGCFDWFREIWKQHKGGSSAAFPFHLDLFPAANDCWHQWKAHTNSLWNNILY